MSEKSSELKEKTGQYIATKKKIIRTAARNKRLAPNTVTTNKLQLLVTVVNRNKTEYYADLIQSFDVNMQVIALAHGTADATTMRYLGLTDTDKSVIFSVIQENKLSDALYTLENRFRTVKGGKGIAYTLPLTSVIGALLFGFLSNNKTVVKEEK